MMLNQGFSFSSAFLGKLVKSSLWHHKLGHPSNEILEVMLMSFDVSFNNHVHVQPCSHCFSGKLSGLSFPERLDKVKVHFHKIHSDVWGPSPVVSIEGFSFMLLL
ncbi:unnamed protein product [Malus baccata var. baccata]